ncbi:MULTISPECIES: RidA family protein [unclassified Pseudomonas]|uniref:RidA family protein n=1 Tax=unclassified Pseudomonas TaxID=196821 RepID=UPI000BC81072|nr:MULTISPECIES: RidA family protein [unclassified Pseudomonas]PVZ08652.1 enamine deaminase RidA (YjgF/YER057c/UK114 family) [Pseudomonas sp. URIL14HWK12:I12]PVZ21079.1 enamine deaminase RidA (YjgF/YER057c/UK114 family) [Pseudomonas sp. URIL14HWK12:I10]PVZ29676.1 enamine deaminase RidA (YjgF/YER057c/UK114 family) [Pseudomonas sp. URIL14HWK12:I11]SNZ18905.1 Enamine deaminase RidA, house cleaning of reactive enamine intermediates, YjgF/YER057c/UK114 family [Pseudomonas sp. URIL14HWK12:I9]
MEGANLEVEMAGITRIETNPKLSRVVVHNGTAWFSGIVAADWTLDIQGQTGQVLSRLDELLISVGSGRSMVLNAQIWMKDMVADFNAMNEVWSNWFAPGETPARATSQVTFDEPGIRLELIVVAAVAAS